MNNLKNIPNYLTISRIVFIPIFILFFYMQPEYLNIQFAWINEILALTFFIISITDFFDGLIARKLNLSSKFGAFLDPVADKLIVCTALILLASQHQSTIITLLTIIIVSREIFVSAIREWLSEVNSKLGLAVSLIAKVKTFTQLMAICFMLFNKEVFGIDFFNMGLISLFIATLLTIWSGINYTRLAIKYNR